MILFPDTSASVAHAAMVFITDKFGWLFLLTGVMPLFFSGWLAFGRFRDVKFGRADEKPEYSTLSWVAMMFTASMGASLIALGFAEPVFYLQSPPLGIEANSSMAFEFAHMYPIYHWSLVPWAIYCLPAIPTVYILSISVNSLGLLADNFARISFWTDPIDRGGFPETWTIFYWAWWFAYSPMMGLFFARISRGRTIRQVVIGIIGLGSLGTFLFLSIAGAYVLYLEDSNLLDAIELLNAEGMATLVAVVIGHLPSPTFILSVVTILTVVFYATTFDSAAYVLASICTKELPGDEEPSRISRASWAVGLALIATSLMIAGGLETVKALTVVTSISALPVLFMMCYTLYKWLQRDFPGLAKQVVCK